MDDDIAFCSELNIRHKAPGFQGYKSFLRKSERRFHGIACYVNNSVYEHTLRNRKIWKLKEKVVGPIQGTGRAFMH